MKKEYDINTFNELMNQLSWDWSEDYPLRKLNDYYAMNKTYIASEVVFYKTESYTLCPKVFAQFEIFYKLFMEE
jgi:hypothetical protein